MKHRKMMNMDEEMCMHHKCKRGKSGCGSGVYCLGAVGAAIYYVSISTGFWMGVLGILKAMVWPAFLVYELLKFLGI